MKRNEHLFQFSGRQISEAAGTEWRYHHDRALYWKERQNVAAEKAKAVGIEIREIAVTGGKHLNAILDPSVQTELALCGMKISSHRAAADRFQIEADCYATQSDRVFDLQPDDVVYFRLAGGIREE